MTSSNGAAPGGYLTAVLDAVRAVRPDVADIDAQTRLAGAGAILDSGGLVSMLVTLEQSIPNIDLAASFMESADRPEEDSPFQTAGTLAEHIQRLMTR
jgi:hypothetical protein